MAINSMKSAIGIALYTVMVLGALSAGWTTLKGLDARRQEGSYMHRVLQLTTMQTIEQMEYQAIDAEAHYDEAQAEHWRLESRGYDYRAKAEEMEAGKEQKRAEMYTNTAAKDQDLANEMWMKVNRTDAERLELLQQLEEENNTEQLLIQGIQEGRFRDGLCGWKGIFRVCYVVGGLTKLQQDADDMDVQIHRDMERLDEVQQKEYMEAIVAEALQGKADQYKHTAEDLLHTAQLWRVQAQRDRQKAEELDDIAEGFHTESIALEERISAYQNWRGQMSAAMQALLDLAKKEKTISVRSFSFSMALLLIPLLFFIHRAVRGAVKIVEDKNISFHDKSGLMEIYRFVYYCFVHAIFFLITAAWCRDYVYHLDQFKTERRAVVVFYFSFLAAFCQSLMLQAIPHALAERPWRAEPSEIWPTLWMIAKYFALRAGLLMPIFAMELLFVWLSPLHGLLLNPSSRLVLAVHVVMATVLLFHYVYMEPRDETVSAGGDNSTIAMENEREFDEIQTISSRETTPLHTTYSVTGTDVFPDVFYSGLTRERDQRLESTTHYSLSHSSPYFVSAHEGFHQVVLLFHIFAVFCMLLIMNINVESLWKGSSTYLFIFIAIVSALMMLKASTNRRPSELYVDMKDRMVYV